MGFRTMNQDKLLEQLRDYEDKWVALLEQDDTPQVVASGSDAFEAEQEARRKGYQNVRLMKVWPFDAGYAPLA